MASQVELSLGNKIKTFENDILQNKKIEEINKYISGIIVDIYEKIYERRNEKNYKHYFNIYENNYVLKRIKDTLIEKCPYFNIELDAEHKFLLIDWLQY